MRRSWEPGAPRGFTEGVRWARIGLAAGIVVVSACAGGDAEPSGIGKPPTERCGEAVQTELDPGLEARTVIAGPVAIVPSRVSPVPAGTSPARNFKLSVQLEATLRTKTPDTTLLFDRDRTRRDNVYSLSDGTRSVRFTGCPDRSAVFVGAVLTTGPRTIDVDVVADGLRTPVTLTALPEATPAF
jgi:hypothetical protein